MHPRAQGLQHAGAFGPTAENDNRQFGARENPGGTNNPKDLLAIHFEYAFMFKDGLTDSAWVAQTAKRTVVMHPSVWQRDLACTHLDHTDLSEPGSLPAFCCPEHYKAIRPDPSLVSLTGVLARSARRHVFCRPHIARGEPCAD